MSNSKIKTEQFAQFGGINSKASPYVTGPMEFLDLSNLDFFTPGSLSERWGSTQYIGQTFPGQITSLFEFSKLDGSSYVISSFSGGIHFGATTGTVQGMSFTLQSVSLSSWYYPVLVKSSSTLSPNSGLQIPYFGIRGQFVTGAVNSNSYSQFFENPVLQYDNTLSSVIIQNYVFMADGNKFVKFDGITTTPVGLPPPLWAYGSSTLSVSDAGITRGYANIGASNTVGLQLGGMYYGVYASYVNNRGFEGPIWPLGVVEGALAGATASASGGSFFFCAFAINTPLSCGISAINCYIYATSSTFPATSQSFSNTDTDFWSTYQYNLVSTTPASGSTITWLPIGTTTGGMSALVTGLFPLPNTTTQKYQPLGLTAVFGGSIPFTIEKNTIKEIDLINYSPRYLDVYQNRLFLAGFSTTPSTVWFSDLSEPEGYAPDFNFEVRTNDGDAISAIRSYSTRLYIFKKRSFHALSGDSPNNFFLQEISAQYGCLNNRCLVIYDDILIFLDQKGVMMWNGASLSNLSSKIQPLIDRINYSVALTTACMEHDKIRNQVLISVPIDGSSINNIILVYDYLIGAWTTYKGIGISSLRTIQGRNNTKNAFYGSYSGTINWFGPSFLADNGTGFTTYLKTRFLHELGDSTQKMYRRLYLNTDAPGSTLAFGVNFFQDYGSSIVLGTTIVLSQFQSRIDFGISAKSLAFEMSNLQTSVPLKIHGFAIESRFLRRV